jgi:hypothetical protein
VIAVLDVDIRAKVLDGEMRSHAELKELVDTALHRLRP